MKKTLLLIGFSIALLFSINAYTGRIYEPVAGAKAPELRISLSDTAETKLSLLKGRYVLLNFWSSTDAESRIAAREYNDISRVFDKGQLCLMSVNFDPSELLFKEIVRIDGLDKKTQIHVSDREALQIKKAYELSDGFKSFLIDPEGRIVAVNPEAKILNKLLGNS